MKEFGLHDKLMNLQSVLSCFDAVLLLVNC